MRVDQLTKQVQYIVAVWMVCLGKDAGTLYEVNRGRRMDGFRENNTEKEENRER